MNEETMEQIKQLKYEQGLLYEKYYNGKATKKDIKRIDEITCELLELYYT